MLSRASYRLFSTSMSKNVAVMSEYIVWIKDSLSGCGVYDGSEIHEAVFMLESLSKRNAKYQCFAPNIDQMHVINHLTVSFLFPSFLLGRTHWREAKRPHRVCQVCLLQSCTLESLDRMWRTLHSWTPPSMMSVFALVSILGDCSSWSIRSREESV